MRLSAAEFANFSPAGFALLVLSLHARLLIIPAFLELLKETLIGEFPLRDLQRLLDIIVIDTYFQGFSFTSFNKMLVVKPNPIQESRRPSEWIRRMTARQIRDA